jgi:hypothetical protein
MKEINSYETFQLDKESGKWNNTGQYQKTVLYQVRWL